MGHKFFADIDVERLMRKEIEPPYKPDSTEELAYFDPKLTQQAGEITESVLPAQQRAIINAGQHNFKGFSS